MATYRRALIPGGTYFFTVVTHQRLPFLAHAPNVHALGRALRRVRSTRPFSMDAFVILPDHLHCIWTLPKEDADYSSRWRDIKKFASREFDRPVGVTQVWQPGFWEHVIRNETDWRRHMDYIHFNPVKHGYTTDPSNWPWSSFPQCVRRGWYEENWGISKPPSSIIDLDCE
ncbi:REP-associated tyrosine transposase [Halomonas dongshanensis]|uniref:REP-associated tyrosine transposase n=1 Tax=Halomonas dongshanensis TaxID=2890835 RepID=UPI003CFFB261